MSCILWKNSFALPVSLSHPKDFFKVDPNLNLPVFEVILSTIPDALEVLPDTKSPTLNPSIELTLIIFVELSCPFEMFVVALSV